MSSTFGGLEMGKSALNAFRLGMQTTGHNISNMNTEGYSRQRVIFSTVTPEDIAHVGQLGQGMYASTIERIRDEFLDFQFRDNQATLGYWDKINDLYDSIQNYIAEPNSTGLRAAMDTFYTNMQALQKSPEDTSTRRALVEAANSIGGMLSNLIYNFNTYNESINMQVQQSVTEANQMLHDLAALNKKITEAEAMQLHALMMCSNPSFILMKPNTLRIINTLYEFRKETDIPVCFTLDAGPNVHLLYPDQHAEMVERFIMDELEPYCHEGRWIADFVGEGPSRC